MDRSSVDPCVLRGASKFTASCAGGFDIIAVFGRQSATRYRFTHAGPVELTTTVVSIRKASFWTRLRSTERTGADDLLLQVDQAPRMAALQIGHAMLEKQRDSRVDRFAISDSRAPIQEPAPVTSNQCREHNRGTCQA